MSFWDTLYRMGNGVLVFLYRGTGCRQLWTKFPDCRADSGSGQHLGFTFAFWSMLVIACSELTTDRRPALAELISDGMSGITTNDSGRHPGIDHAPL